MIIIDSVHFDLSLGMGKIKLLDELIVLFNEGGPFVLDVLLHAIDLVLDGVPKCLQ